MPPKVMKKHETSTNDSSILTSYTSFFEPSKTKFRIETVEAFSEPNNNSVLLVKDGLSHFGFHSFFGQRHPELYKLVF